MNERMTLWSVTAVLGVFALTLAGCPLIPDAEDLSFDLDDFDTSQFFDSDELFGEKDVVVNTADGGCFSFHTDETLCAEDGGTPDIMVEPSAQLLAPVCGNWVATEFTLFEEVTEPPAEGYNLDVEPYNDCPEVVLDKVLVFKLEDSTYAKAIVVEDLYDEVAQQHQLTIEYVWPMVF